MTMFLAAVAVIGGAAAVSAALGAAADRLALDRSHPPPLDGSHERIVLSDEE